MEIIAANVCAVMHVCIAMPLILSLSTRTEDKRCTGIRISVTHWIRLWKDVLRAQEVIFVSSSHQMIFIV